MSHTYPVTVASPRIRLKAIRRRTTGPNRSDVGPKPSVTFTRTPRKTRSSKLHVGELVGEAYAALSLAGIIGVLIYHIAG